MSQVEKEIAPGHIPSGLFIVTAVENDKKQGYLASWVQQVSFEPMMVAVTIKKDRPGYEHIKAGKRFAINVVGDHDMNYLKHFWSGYDPEKSPFDEIDHTVTNDGALLIKQAKSAIECEASEVTEPGDHVVVFAKVCASHVFNNEAKPKVHIRKTGSDY